MNSMATRSRSTLPTDVIRSGDFSGLARIYDPLSTDRSGLRTVFPDNRIPVGSLDRVAQQFLSKIPLPNRAGITQNLVSSEKETTDMDQLNARLDHRLSG